MEDIEGEECSLVIEHVFDNLHPFEQRQEADLAFFYLDDPELCSRNGVHVEKGNGEDPIVRFSGSTGDNTMNVIRLQKVVYHAVQTGETEVDLRIGGERDGGACEWGAWALVDLSCNRVYAFKVLLKQGHLVNKKTMACLGYVLCPDYGDVIDETRVVQYAVEKVKFPGLESFVAQDLVQDDSVDDFVPESPKPSPGAPPGASSAQLGLPGDFNARLTSIDLSLTRIATAVELLVGHLTQKVE
jgi:hypothetical protein